MINSRTFVAGVPVKSKPDVSVCVSVHVDVCVWLNDSVTQNLITSVLRIAQPCAFAQLTLKPYSAFLVTSYCTLNNYSLCTLTQSFCVNRRCGTEGEGHLQGDMHMVAVT